MVDNQDLQILVKDILEGVGAMIDASENRVRNETRVLIEAQDKKISAIAEQVSVLSQDVATLKKDVAEMKEDIFDLKSDMRVVKAVITTHSEEIHTLKRAK